MTNEILLKFNREVSINPEFAPIDSTAVEKSPKTVQMVSADSIDTDMSDKIEFKTAQTPQAKEVQQEETPWYKRAWDATCETAKNATHWVIIQSNRIIESEDLQKELATEYDLSDSNRVLAGDVSVNSEKVGMKKLAGKFTAGMKDAKLQMETTLRHAALADEAVLEGYADEYHNFHEENLAPTANVIVQHSCTTTTVQKVIKKSVLCPPKSQANVTGAIADGIVQNKNFNDDTKTGLGVDLAKNVVNLDETQQSEAYTKVAEKLNQYQAVVEEVKYQVTNVAKEQVKKDTLSKLENSAYQNVKKTFAQKAVKEAQDAFKASNNGQISKEQARIIKQAVEIDLNNAIKEGVKEAKRANVAKVENSENSANSKAKEVTNPFKQGNVIKLGYTKIRLSDYDIKNANETELQALQNCTTVDEFAKYIKDIPTNDLKNMFKNISKNTKEDMFSRTTSVYLQAFLLKSGTVKYEEVEKDCLPGIKAQIDVFTLNNDIEYAIQRLNG